MLEPLHHRSPNLQFGGKFSALYDYAFHFSLSSMVLEKMAIKNWQIFGCL
jgi:hypothetical protein